MAQLIINSQVQALAWGRETTYGTAVTRTAAIKLNPGCEWPAWNVNRTKVEELGRHSDTAYHVARYVIGIKQGTFSLRYSPQYANGSVGLLVDGIGQNTTTGAGPFVHTARLNGDWNATGATGHQSLTIEALLGRDNTTPANYNRVFSGCRTNRYTFSIAPGQEAEVTQEFVYQTVADVATGSNFATMWQTGAERPILHSQLTAAKIVWNSIDIVGIRSLSYTIDHALVERQWLGQAYPATPVRSRPSVQIEAEIEVTDTNIALLEDYEDGDSSNLTFDFDGVGTLAYAPTFHNCVIVEPPSMSGTAEGVQTMRVVWSPTNDHTNYGVAIAVTNGNTNYYDQG